MKKTKVVCVIDQTNCNKEDLINLVLEGMNTACFNMLNVNHNFCRKTITIIREINKEYNTNISIMFDLIGPAIRLGKLEKDEIILKENDEIKLVNSDIIGNKNIIPIRYSTLIDDVKVSSKICFGNKINGEVVTKTRDSLIVKILNNGSISSDMLVDISNNNSSNPYISEIDKKSIELAVKLNIDFLSLPYVRSNYDVIDVTDLLIKLNNEHISILAKIENEKAIVDLQEILKVCDGAIFVHDNVGGDLAPEKLPLYAKQVLEASLKMSKLGLLQMRLKSNDNSFLQQEEINNIYDVVVAGYDALILSGNNLVNDINTVTKIILSAEEDFNHLNLLDTLMLNDDINVANAIAYSVVNSAIKLRSRAIVTATNSGKTALNISCLHPICPIIALSPNLDTVLKLTLNYGVYPLLVKKYTTTDKVIKCCRKKAIDIFDIKEGDNIIITGGLPINIEETNFMNIEKF